MQSFSITELRNQGDVMTVRLKERVCVDAEGRAVPAGHPASRFLVGPEGATITDEQAKSLSLVDGRIVVKPDAVEQSILLSKGHHPDGDKGHHPDGDKSQENKNATRKQVIVNTMEEMVKEARDIPKQRAELFTNNDAPDANVISSRVGFIVKAKERDDLWDEMK